MRQFAGEISRLSTTRGRLERACQRSRMSCRKTDRQAERQAERQAGLACVICLIDTSWIRLLLKLTGAKACYHTEPRQGVNRRSMC